MIIKIRKVFSDNVNLSFTSQITLIFVLLNIVFIAFLHITLNNRYELILDKSMSQELKVVDGFFRYPENIINILSQNKDLLTYESDNRHLRNDMLSLFESIIIPDSRISNIYFIPSSGRAISYKFIEKPSDYFTQKAWFKESIDGKRQYLWISHKSDFSTDEVISCTRIVVNKYNDPIGVVGLDIELFKLSELIQGTRIEKDGYFIILNSDNKIIADPYYKHLSQYIPYDNLANIITINKSFILKIDNQEFKCKFSQIDGLPWSILGVVPLDEIKDNIRNSSILFFFISMCIFILVLITYSKIKVNRKLKTANERLKEYASTIEELAISQERNRMARDVHDTLGQTLSILITLLQVSINSCKKDVKETEENLNKAMKITREGLNEVRRSISGLMPEKLENSNLFDALEKLTNEFEFSGINIDLSVNKLDQNISSIYSETIYRVCQEALTNSIKHGSATEVSIIIKFSDEYIKLFIFDNGLGCKGSINKKGFGLQAMKQRIEKLNGQIEFGSGDTRGFNIHVELPLTNVKEGTLINI